MKVHQYREMMRYLTRPPAPTSSMQVAEVTRDENLEPPYEYKPEQSVTPELRPSPKTIPVMPKTLNPEMPDKPFMKEPLMLESGGRVGFEDGSSSNKLMKTVKNVGRIYDDFASFGKGAAGRFFGYGALLAQPISSAATELSKGNLKQAGRELGSVLTAGISDLPEAWVGSKRLDLIKHAKEVGLDSTSIEKIYKSNDLLKKIEAGIALLEIDPKNQKQLEKIIDNSVKENVDLKINKTDKDNFVKTVTSFLVKNYKSAYGQDVSEDRLLKFIDQEIQGQVPTYVTENKLPFKSYEEKEYISPDFSTFEGVGPITAPPVENKPTENKPRVDLGPILFPSPTFDETMVMAANGGRINFNSGGKLTDTGKTLEESVREDHKKYNDLLKSMGKPTIPLDNNYIQMWIKTRLKDGGIVAEKKSKAIPMDLESVSFRLFGSRLDDLTYNQKQTVYDYIEDNRNKKANGGRINFQEGSEEKTEFSEIPPIKEDKPGGGIYFGVLERRKPIVATSGGEKEAKQFLSSLITNQKPAIGYGGDNFNVYAAKSLNPYDRDKTMYEGILNINPDSRFFVQKQGDYTGAGFEYDKENIKSGIRLSKGEMGRGIMFNIGAKFAKGGVVD